MFVERDPTTREGALWSQIYWCCYMVRKNPANLTTGQKTTLAELEAVNAELFRAYLLKEQLREVFRRKGAQGQSCCPGGSSGPAAAASQISKSSAAQSKDAAR